MKKLQRIVLFICTLHFGIMSLAQSKEAPEKNPINKEVDKINKTSDEVNSTVENANQTVKSTVTNTKETINSIGELFGTGKGKNKKSSKAGIKITIQQITYDDESLNTLYAKLTNTKGVKKISKNYANGIAIITIDSKENADAIWQKTAKDIRNPFKILQIGEKDILLQLTTTNK